MKDTVETGGTACSDDEAQAVLTIMFAGRVGDAIRALRAYCDKRIAEALAEREAERE